MQIHDHLVNLGLTEKQAHIYIAALELGAETVGAIAKQANIKRPTAYVIIDELIQKGLLSEKPNQKTTTYVAEPPETLQRVLKERQDALEKVLPLLNAMYRMDEHKPQVRVYEGKEGIMQFYKNELYQSKTGIRFFSSIKQLTTVFDNLLDTWISLEHIQKDTKEIINADPEDLAYAAMCKEKKLTHEIRVIPKDHPYTILKTDNAIFEDKIMFVSLEGKLFTTVIQSEILAQTMRAIYDLAWEHAVPVEKYLGDTR